MPKGMGVSENWLNRKNLSFICTRKDFPSLYHVDFYKELEQGFSLLAPMYHFLISGIE